MSELIKPEKFTVETSDGKKLDFILSNFPAVQGREIITQYPMTGLPKIGDYEKNKDIMFKIMSFVAVEKSGVQIRLATEELINNHCPDWEVLAKVEFAMMEKNCSFFRNGRHFDFLENLVQMFTKKALEMWMASSEQLSPTAEQPSTN